MKFKNIFKKEAASISKNAKVQTLDKNQLEKVIGGIDAANEMNGEPESAKIVNGGKITGSISINNPR